ncbi:hypothetical protein C1645_823044 [Glomus cerebriforme]|uniref:Uncharacterized protein n=1 Tax=Glomus cerebriforme TaxID=658196 RepID=A0A397SWU3_9GLOM|nr:hypothetical protein C1645_823044 [Glomus cerebriforme]
MDKNHMTNFLLMGRKKNSDVLNNIARLYEDACNAEDKTIKANQVGIKKTKGLIYDFIFIHNFGTKRNTLYQRIGRARKIYGFIKKIGIDKIKYIKTYSANSIAKLFNSKIQTIIDYFFKNPDTKLLNNQDSSIIDSSLEKDELLEVEDFWEKIIRETFEEDEARIEKERENKASSNVVIPAKGLRSNQKANEVKLDNENNSSDSEEKMLDESNDDGYNGYSGYDKYDDRNRGYYYHNGRYKRKVSPMMSPIIFPVIT